RELAAVERAKILKGEANIGSRRRKDILFDKAVEEFITWADANKRPKTVSSYKGCVTQLKKSFSGKRLSEIHPFLIEKYKQARLSEGVRVAVNRELTCLKEISYKATDWGSFEGPDVINRRCSIMNPWIAKAVILAASIVMFAIRAPHGKRGRAVKTVRNCKGPREVVLLVLAWIGFLVPLIWVASPAFWFADYPLHLTPLVAGITCLLVGLWHFYRSHADL